jgi:phenylpyruvate tautomerase PptA (4-oxalocrotonate tautomerase family)
VAQIKIYGRGDQLRPIRTQLSDLIHGCVVEALHYPAEKRFHRFFPLEAEDFIFPQDRGPKYTIIEISMFEGRSVAARKQLIRLLFDRLETGLGIEPQDIEITISETPRANWGIRGQHGDELGLGYNVEV